MLVLSRKVDEQIVIDAGRVRISVLGIKGGRVRLGIVAPSEVPVIREETLAASHQSQNHRTTWQLSREVPAAS